MAASRSAIRTAGPPAAAVPAAAALIGAWIAADVVRANQLSSADAALWFESAACVAALAAAIALGRWPECRRMAMLILWWVLLSVGGDVAGAWPASRLAATALLLATALQAPAYAHMVLAYPSGFVHDRLDRSFVAIAYAIGALWQLPPALFADFRCTGCSPRVPSLAYTGETLDLTVVGRVFSGVFIALGVAFVALLLRRARQVPQGAWRTLAPLAAAAVFAAAEFVVLRAASLTDWTAPVDTLAWLDRANLLVLPVAIFAGIAAIRRDRGVVGDLVVELGAVQPGGIRAALARAVGDPALELALWLPEKRRFVDENGDAVTVNGHADGDRAVTLIGPEQQPLAAIVHDPALVGQRRLLEAAGSAARLALENARLHAELRASRAHAVAGADQLEALTARESEILALLAQGLTDRGIAERLWLTPRTVETHIRHILLKLDLPADSAHNRRVLAVLAYLGQDGSGEGGRFPAHT